MISTNENLILNRLKAVEKSSEDIIKVSIFFLPASLSFPFCLSVLLALSLTSIVYDNNSFIHLYVFQRKPTTALFQVRHCKSPEDA